MYKKFVILGFVLFMTVALVQIMGNGDSHAQGDSGYFVFLSLVRNDPSLPLINYFQANVAVADPGDTIELSWDTTNAISVTIYHLMPTGQLDTFWHVATTGTMTYTISPLERNHTAVQHTSNSYSDTYIRAADGNVWRLLPEFSGWEKVIVTAGYPLISIKYSEVCVTND